MVDKIPGAAVTPSATTPQAADFGKALKSAAPKTPAAKPPPVPKHAAPAEVNRAASADPTKAAAPTQKAQATQLKAAKSVTQAAPSERPGGARILTQVQAAQARLDQLLKMAESGRTFTPAELLAFQAHAYRASQELEMASKVVEKGTSAVKQTLQTQI